MIHRTQIQYKWGIILGGVQDSTGQGPEQLGRLGPDLSRMLGIGDL